MDLGGLHWLFFMHKHTLRILGGIVLRSVFLGTKEEIDWAFVEGPQYFAPDLYKSFIDYLDNKEKKML